MRDETKLIHSGYETDPTTKSVATPIYQTVSYEFECSARSRPFQSRCSGKHYTRIMNPTTAVLEQRVADLEGGVGALAVSAGSAAITYAIQNLTSVGTNIVATPQLYGGTYTLFAYTLPSQGVEVKFAASDTPEAIEAAIDQNTRAIFCESIGNPAGNVVDLEALSKVAARAGIPLVVDNTVATPVLIKPIEYGADIVVHSLTKYMGGHGNSLGGVIVDSGKFPWDKHPDQISYVCRTRGVLPRGHIQRSSRSAAFIGKG